MKAFVFSDLHASERQLYNFKKYFEAGHDIDLLIFAGDLVNMGEPVSFVTKFNDAISKINLPFFWVPGNNDFGRSYFKLNAKYPSLEGKVVEFKKSVISTGAEKSFSEKISRQARDDNMIKFSGVGGSPASWAGQYAGEKMIDKKDITGSIFVSHTPPPGLLVMNKYDWPNPNIEYRNSKQIQNSNKKNSKQVSDFGFRASGLRLSDSPIVHICGHQHSRWGVGYLGTTKVINPGPLEWGRYAIVNLENLEVKFSKFV